MLEFGRPEFLWLLLLIAPIAALSWPGRAHEGHWRWLASLSLRVLVVVAMVGSLSVPSLRKESDAVATAFVVDQSGSLPPQIASEAQRFAGGLAAAKSADEDQVAFVYVARVAEIAAPPSTNATPVIDAYTAPRDATDLAAGVRRAISILPPELAKRVVLISDGNENAGSLLAEAELAAARGIPIDVVPLDFEAANEVLIESLRAPTRASIEQTIELRLAVRSQGFAEGTIFLRDTGMLVDLDPDAPGDGLFVALEPGVRTFVFPRQLSGAGTHRFEAIFEPATAAEDRIEVNNRGTAVTIVDGAGRVLVIDGSGGVESAPLVEALGQASIEALVLEPSEVLSDGAVLSGFDAIILANVPRWTIDGELDRLLRAYVHDVGGGLLMLGGPQSLGAGGWIASEVASTLPVLLDPPATRSYLRGSVAIVLDASGSMASPAMGAFAHKQAMANEAAAAGVRSLSHLDEVCVIAFSGAPEIVVPRRPIGRDTFVERQIRGITSGGGTNLHWAMKVALDELAQSTAGTKHMIVLTDGMTAGAPEDGFALAERARSLGVTVSTIGIEEGAGDPHLKRIAEIASGRFHPVTDLASARALPEIFIREFNQSGRRMSVEGEFQPTVLPATSGPLRGLQAVPRISGYTVTLPRPGLAALDIVLANSEATDPIFASWNHGLGRAAVFTSDAGARWATEWPSWGEYRAFWEQTVRWLMRPSAPSNAVARTRIDGDRAIVDLEITRKDGGFDLVTEPRGAVVSPDGSLASLRLEQVGAGRWRGEFDLSTAGTHLASIALSEDEFGRRSSVFTAVHAPYAREYRVLGSNRALLEQVAARTGGRVIELSAPVESVDAFLRAGALTPLMSRGLWDLLAIAAGVLFLLDVAYRRVVFDWSALGGAAREGLAPRAPRDGIPAVLAALGRVRAGARAGHATETEVAAPRPAVDVAARAFSVTRVAAQPSAPSPAVEVAAPSEPEGPRGAGTDGAESTAAKLLRAKRRAAEDLDGRGG
ncbi:MAG: VWA domain-containing protein [Phycisphaera sp.]|nr:VWA domain-containing protein [Phycisphaera sp.]